MLDRVRDFIDRTPLLKKPHVFLKLAARRWRRDEALRERAAASGAFALIAMFALGSVDYLVTGGPDWNPGGEAQAAELPRAAPILAVERAPEPVVAPPPSLILVAAALPDWSVAAEDLLGGPEPAFASEPAAFENASYLGDDAPAVEQAAFVNVVAAYAPAQPRSKSKG